MSHDKKTYLTKKFGLSQHSGGEEKAQFSSTLTRQLGD
ncbi:hypothetical protein BBR47_45070 [Brevibacillus brevis NBRC 100599]|uniref:Uncharacterized protein n=1 Tax=Brevibacillus brevis (strain 47 / JCM 6285 / NBRC 100599) TaxID=358681 RepID=C0ZJA9_BREBN|nr:hypothetical protein BBR47_45070 [Brevibacillus brevis NBRC 100599]